MNLDGRIARLEGIEPEERPPCTACGARKGSRIVVWVDGEPEPDLDCPQCHARVLLIHQVPE